MLASPIQHAIEHRMNHEATRIRLVGRRHDLESIAEAVGDDSEIGLIPERVVKTLPSRERLGGTVESLRSQQRRPQPVARGVTHADAFGRHAQAFAEAGGLCRGGAERGDELALVETEQLATGSRRAEHAAGRGDVPALIIVLRRDREPDASLHLLAEDEGEQQIRPAHPAQLGQREHRGRHRRSRMDHSAQMGVAEIMDIGGGGVEEAG
jgi:hypothetical protein